MKPETIDTSCWRGFYVTYILTDKALYLRELTLNEINANYRPINRIMPEIGDYQATYHNLSLVIPFTGQIRLAKGFIEKYYVHMGYQKPIAYKTVLDVSLKDGQILEIIDLSWEMRKRRWFFWKRKKPMDMIEWIDDAFSLDMDSK
jgi:hypothetical protein